MTPIRSYGPTIVLLVTVLGVMIAGPGLVREIAHEHKLARVNLIKNSLVENEGLAQLSQAFERVADAVEPSVVHIEIHRHPSTMAEELFQRFRPRGRDRDRDRNRPPFERDGRYDQYDPTPKAGNGSGWVYDSQGHIITNRHVVENAEEIVVKFADGTERDAEVVGIDWGTDVAVIKVNASNLIPATICDEPVQKGEIVFAFGSPLGEQFSFSMSQGIISGMGRQLGINNGYDSYYIQTDAAINQGNSGGPLVNIYGELVGMNTAIAAGSGGFRPGFIGLGFAIPGDIVRTWVDQIIATGTVTRGFLGINIATLTPRMAETFGFDGKGVLVHDLEPDTPAGKSGIKPDDIITHVNGKQVEAYNELQWRITSTAPGTEVKITLFRNGQTLNLPVVLGERPQPNEPRFGLHDPDEDEVEVQVQSTEILRKFGFEATDEFTEEMADGLDVDFHAGVLVRKVRPGSVAHIERLSPTRADPIILIVNVMGATVTTEQELAAELSKQDLKDPVRIRVMHWNGKRYIGSSRVLELPED